MKIVGIEYAGKADVYNMEVPDTHSFIVSGGIVSHNCYDDARYMMMDHPIPTAPKPRAKPKVYDPYSEHRRTK